MYQKFMPSTLRVLTSKLTKAFARKCYILRAFIDRQMSEGFMSGQDPFYGTGRVAGEDRDLRHQQAWEDPEVGAGGQRAGNARLRI